MPMFGNILGGTVGLYDFTWERWAQWHVVQKTGTTPPPPVLWDTKSGCKEKFQMVPIMSINPED